MSTTFEGLPATHEQIGTTRLGDPEIVVTITEPHPLAGRQFLCRSTASMEHMRSRNQGSRVRYLVDDHPPRRPNFDSWHGALECKTDRELVAGVVEHADWLHRRDWVANQVWASELSEHLERFRRSLEGSAQLDFEKEWAGVMDEVARIQLVMVALPSATEATAGGDDARPADL